MGKHSSKKKTYIKCNLNRYSHGSPNVDKDFQLTLAEQNFVAQKYYKEKMSVQAIFKNYHKERVQVKRSDSKTWAQGLSKRGKLQLFSEWNQAYSARKKEKWAKEAEIANAQFRKKLAED